MFNDKFKDRIKNEKYGKHVWFYMFISMFVTII